MEKIKGSDIYKFSLYFCGFNHKYILAFDKDDNKYFLDIANIRKMNKPFKEMNFIIETKNNKKYLEVLH